MIYQPRSRVTGRRRGKVTRAFRCGAAGSRGSRPAARRHRRPRRSVLSRGAPRLRDRRPCGELRRAIAGGRPRPARPFHPASRQCVGLRRAKPRRRGARRRPTLIAAIERAEGLIRAGASLEVASIGGRLRDGLRRGRCLRHGSRRRRLLGRVRIGREHGTKLRVRAIHLGDRLKGARRYRRAGDLGGGLICRRGRGQPVKLQQNGAEPNNNDRDIGKKRHRSGP